MNKYMKLDLVIDKDKNKKLYYNKEYLNPYKKDLDNFFETKLNINDISFAKKMMMSQELKANNSIEGIIDDLELIDKIVKNKEENKNYKEKKRIINLYKGYKYILQGKDINKNNLKELYSLLSDELLNKHDKSNMGDYYRNGPVYILEGNRLDTEPLQGMPVKYLDYYMNNFFEYINSNNNLSEIESFIKSQIMHYYFVYIHPYFDVNGRTARTTAMWHLLNEEAYPYIIFNRAISLNKRKYTYKLNDVRRRGDITLFLRYMLKEVLKEFEKEKIISNIKENSNQEITRPEAQIIEYLLTLKGELTILDLATKYNAYNMYKDPEEIASSYIYPLIEKGILINNGPTKHRLTKDMPNIKLAISSDLLDIDKDKIKSINLQKYLSKQL